MECLMPADKLNPQSTSDVSFSAYFFYFRYVGDMLAWLHQAIASEKELLHSLLRHSTSSMCERLYFFKTEFFIEVT